MQIDEYTLDFATARLAMRMPVSHPSISIGCEYQY